MDTAILTAVIGGLFSLLTALASVWLKDHLERRHTVPAPGHPETIAEERVIIRPARGWSLSRPLAVLVGGFILGVLVRLLDQASGGPTHYANIAGIFLMAIVCVRLMLNHRKSRRGFWPYQLETIALWAAYFSGWSSLIHGHVLDSEVYGCISSWFLLAVAGGIVVIARRQKAEPA